MVSIPIGQVAKLVGSFVTNCRFFPDIDVEVCKILVCIPGDANPGLYTRVRFALLASSWLPVPLGIGLWRALRVVMLVGGSVCWALMLVFSFLFIPYFAIWLGCCLSLFAVMSVAVDLVLFAGRSVRFCWSVVGFLASHAPIGNWRGAFWCTPKVWGLRKQSMEFLETLFILGMPCMRGSYYRESKDQKWESWARWWGEVVHSREAIIVL